VKMRRFVSLALAMLTVSFLLHTQAGGGEWTRVRVTPELGEIQNLLPPENRQDSLEYACDFSHMRDQLLPRMEWHSWMANFSVAVAISYVASCGVAIAGGAGMTAPAAGWASSPANQAAMSAGLGTTVQSLLGLDISNWTCGTTAAELKGQMRRLQQEAGISDNFLFAQVRRYGDATFGRTITLPLGAPIRIYARRPTLSFPIRPPALALKYPQIDFGQLGSSLQEFSISTERQTDVTVSRVFASEKLNGQPVPAPATPLDVETGNALLAGRIRGGLALSRLQGVGYGGLREVHITSPVNSGLAFKESNDDYLFAVVISDETIRTHGPSAPVTVGTDLTVALFLIGLHGNRGPFYHRGSEFSWEQMAEEVLSGCELRGAGIASSQVFHDPRGSKLIARPTQPGLVDLVVKTWDGEVVFPRIARVEGGGVLEGRWQLERNGSIIRVVFNSQRGVFQGILEEDRLQYFSKGDVMWDDIRPSSTSPSVYVGVERRSDGSGNRVMSRIVLALEAGGLVYQEGNERHRLQRVK
jgi:hypothetical protein